MYLFLNVVVSSFNSTMFCLYCEPLFTYEISQPEKLKSKLKPTCHVRNWMYICIWRDTNSCILTTYYNNRTDEGKKKQRSTSTSNWIYFCYFITKVLVGNKHNHFFSTYPLYAIIFLHIGGASEWPFQRLAPLPFVLVPVT